MIFTNPINAATRYNLAKKKLVDQFDVRFMFVS